MAVAQRGTQFQRTSGTGTVTVNRTTGWAGSAPVAGTYLVAVAGSNDQPNFDTLSLTASTGWTLRATQTDGSPYPVRAWTRVADGTANDTLTITDAQVNGSDDLHVMVVGWDGATSFSGITTGITLGVGAPVATISTTVGSAGDGLTFAVLEQYGQLGRNNAVGDTFTSPSGTLTTQQNAWGVYVGTEVLGTPGSRQVTSARNDNYYWFAVAVGAGGVTIAATAALTATATLTATGTVTRPATATLSATSALTATATRTQLATAALAATATLTVTAVREAAATVTLAASSTLTATAIREAAATVALAATSTLTAAGTIAGATVANLVTTATLTAATFVGRFVTALLTATHTLTAVPAAGRITYRPGTGTASRPDTGVTARTAAGTTSRTSGGTTTRPNTGTTTRP